MSTDTFLDTIQFIMQHRISHEVGFFGRLVKNYYAKYYKNSNEYCSFKLFLGQLEQKSSTENICQPFAKVPYFFIF